MPIQDFMRSFLPHGVKASLREKVRSGFAGGCAILLLAVALHYLPQHSYPLLLLGSMAASAVLLFAAPHSPFSQPWNLIGGHVISAIIGWLCSLLITNSIIAAGVAVGIAILLMYILHCLHPPGAATALILVLGSVQFQTMGLQWIVWVVIANVGILLLLALLINNLLPGRRYPMQPIPPMQHKIEPQIVPERGDFEWALTQMDSVIDISVEDLTEIYEMAKLRAEARYDSKTNPS